VIDDRRKQLQLMRTASLHEASRRAVASHRCSAAFTLTQWIAYMTQWLPSVTKRVWSEN